MTEQDKILSAILISFSTYIIILSILKVNAIKELKSYNNLLKFVFAFIVFSLFNIFLVKFMIKLF